MPWPALKYNVELGGYQIMIPIEKLKAGPKYEAGAEWDWAAGTKSVGEYYGA